VALDIDVPLKPLFCLSNEVVKIASLICLAMKVFKVFVVQTRGVPNNTSSLL